MSVAGGKMGDGGLRGQYDGSRPPASGQAKSRLPVRLLRDALPLVFLLGLGCASFAAPRNDQADLFGVIEIGGSGVKASVIQITPSHARDMEDRFLANGDELKYEMLSSDRITPYLEVETSVEFKENIPQTVRATEEFTEKMYADRAVPRERIFVVVSSGVQNKPHFGELMEKLKSSDKIFDENVSSVSSEDECSLTYRWIVPQYRYDEAVVVDIGSSIANACYMENPGTDHQRMRAFALIRFGTKGFAKHVNAELAARKIDPALSAFAALSTELRRSVIEPELDVKRATHPGLENLPRLYLAGGIAWATATLVRPEKSFEPDGLGGVRGARWVQLSANDFLTLHNRAVDDNAYAVDTRLILDKKMVDEIEKTTRRMKQIFNPDQMIAGTDLLLALKQRLKLDKKQRIYFAGVARDGWRSQYLLEKISAQKVSAHSSESVP
jgi:hypothetical protein